VERSPPGRLVASSCGAWTGERRRGGCAAAGAALLAWPGGRSRGAAGLGGVLVLGGELAMRWSVFKAGFQSARDPKFVVVPQSERPATAKSRRVR
jgi:hypothetical protein